MNTINLEKIAYSKDSYDKVVDRNFNQLIIPGVKDPTQTISLDDFFDLYDSVFLTIPKEGDIKSHRYILNRTSDYLDVKLAEDVDVDALLEEITMLRQELLDQQELVSQLINK